jgi:hypothetical protein
MITSDAGTAVLGASTGSAAASMALSAWAQTTLQAAAAGVGFGNSERLQLQGAYVSAKWADAAAAGPVSSPRAGPVTSRHLLTADAGVIQGSAASQGPLRCAGQATSHNAADVKPPPEDCTPGQAGTLCASPAPVQAADVATDQAAGEASTTGPYDEGVESLELDQTGTSRRILQASSATGPGGTPLVQLDVALSPQSLLQLTPAAASAASGTTSSTSQQAAAGFLGVGQALVVGLERQAVASSSTSSSGSGGSSSASGPLLLRVMLVQRVGLCGNGVCEVGERALLNAAGGVLQEADAPCPQVGGVMARQCGQHYLCSTCLGGGCQGTPLLERCTRTSRTDSDMASW